MKRLLRPLVSFLPLPLMRTVLPGRVFIVCYHAVSSHPLPHIRHLYDIKSPDQFEQDLLFLKEHCHVASHDELVAHQIGRHPLPAGSVCVTFDDGFSACHEVVRPLLVKHHVPCTFFVCKSLIDNRAMMFRNAISLCLDVVHGMTEEAQTAVLGRLGARVAIRFTHVQHLRSWMIGLTYPERDKVNAACDVLELDIDAFLRRERPYMTSEQIVDLARAGFTIGGHSCNHPELWLLDWKDAAREIVDSCDAVRQ